MAVATGGAVLISVLRRDRMILVCGLLFLCVSSWAYLLSGAGMSVEEMGDMLMPTSAVPWTPRHALLVFGMWSVMMAAMMLPSAAPMILFHATIARGHRKGAGPSLTSGFFVCGYIAVWAGFSLAAVAMQFGLDQAALLDPMFRTTSVTLASSVLIACGVYQWTPLKQACLRRCRSPLEFVTTHWRGGLSGAFVMGVQHGIYCVGCCWMLMLLLFVGGVMSIGWIVAIAILILLEKVAFGGHWISRGVGSVLVVWGAATVLRGSLY